PAGTVKEMPSTAVKSPNRLTRFSASIAGGEDVAPEAGSGEFTRKGWPSARHPVNRSTKICGHYRSPIRRGSTTSRSQDDTAAGRTDLVAVARAYAPALHADGI